MSRLIKGLEHYLHVWTLGAIGVGDGADKLMTIDADPASKRFGKVIHTLSVGGRGEAHHMGFTDDRKYLWAGRLDDNPIFVFDVDSNPAKPRLVNTIKDFAAKTKFAGPHTFYALPGRMMIQALSNTKDHGGATMVLWDLQAMEPTKVFDVPGAPLEIRWSLNGSDNWAISATALTSKLWLVKQDAAGQWQAKDAAMIGDPAKIPLPVDISITAHGKGL